MKTLIGTAPIFPTSPMDIQPYRKENQSEADVASMIRESWLESYPNLSMNLTRTYRISVELPPLIEAGNLTFIVANRTFSMNSLYAPTPEGALELTFRPLGRRIDSFTFAQYAPSDAELAAQGNQSNDGSLVWNAPAGTDAGAGAQSGGAGNGGSGAAGNASSNAGAMNTTAPGAGIPALNGSEGANGTAYPGLADTGALYTPQNAS